VGGFRGRLRFATQRVEKRPLESYKREGAISGVGRTEMNSVLQSGTGC
jgi:hypothetical protein